MAIARDTHMDNDRNQQRVGPSGRKTVAKNAFRWVFARFMLLLGLCGICAIGTFAFQALEMPNELSQCEANSKIYNPMEEETALKLWRIGQSYYLNQGNAKESDTMEQMNGVVQQFVSDIRALGNFDGRNCSLMGTANGEQYKWNTFGSVLFATTIFTTVGYGNIAPVTTWGRIVVFAYGMISIPYMLWCLSLLGELLADVFQFVYVNVCCLGLCARRARRRQREKIAAEHKKKVREAMIAKKLGVTGVPMSWKELYDAREEEMNKLRGQADALMVDDDENDDEDEDEDVAIPLTVTLLVIFGYIGLGAVMFGMWEGWEAMAAAYYCFVTISTIGFGDIVPGAAAKGVKATSDAVKLLVVAIYIFAGMAIISMAFNLIQENMAKKARAIEQKLLKNKTGEEENNTDDDDSTSPEPLTARNVMPAMPAMLPTARPQPTMFSMPPVAENWAEKVKAMNQPSQQIMSIPEERQLTTSGTDGRTSDVKKAALEPQRDVKTPRSASAKRAKNAKQVLEETSFSGNTKEESASGSTPEVGSLTIDGGHVEDVHV